MKATGEKKTVKGEGIRIGEWTIQGLLARARISGAGPGADCDGTCCRHGVYVSLPERDRILAHADAVRGTMDATQTPDLENWFEADVHEDEDFEGGRCIGTAIHHGKCVFLNREGLCTLQLLEPELPLPDGVRLKPFYCRLFPLTTWYGRLEFDDLCDGVRPCCTLTREGGTPAVEAYAFEFREALGEEGYRRLRDATR